MVADPAAVVADVAVGPAARAGGKGEGGGQTEDGQPGQTHGGTLDTRRSGPASAGNYASTVLGLLASAAAGYLVGTVPCADTAARLATGDDTGLRTQGTGNPGAVNAMAVLGKAWGWSILAADAGQGGAGLRRGPVARSRPAPTSPAPPR